MIEIVSATSEDAIEHVISLSQEYTHWLLDELQTRYPDIDSQEFMSERSYDDLRRKFPGEHVPPHGCLLIAMRGNEVCGCVALARLSKTIGEIRTLYVRPGYRGTGAGKKLAEAVLETARTFGYSSVRLDTLAFMTEAQTLYRSLGFYDIGPYHEISPSLEHIICFFERQLSD